MAETTRKEEFKGKHSSQKIQSYKYNREEQNSTFRPDITDRYNNPFLLRDAVSLRGRHQMGWQRHRQLVAVHLHVD